MRILIALLLLSGMSYAQKKDYVDSLNKVLLSKPHDTVEVLTYCKLASEYRYNEPEKALKYAADALSRAQEIGFQEGISRSNQVFGLINMNQGNFDKALEFYLKALTIDHARGNKNAISISNNNIGMVYWNQGNYEKALKYYLISLKIDEELGNQSGMASSFNNIGLIYWAQNNLDKALDNFTQVITIYSGLKDRKGMAGAYSNIGGVNFYKGKKDLSVIFFKKALVLYEEINHMPGMSTTCCNISDVLIDQLKYDEALVFSTRALNIEKAIGNKAQMCFVYMAMGKIYASKKQYDRALENVNEAGRIAEEIGVLKQLSETYNLRAQIYMEIGRFKEAYENHVKYSNTKDSLFNQENSSKIAEMDAKYSTDKKNKEIELLKKQKEIQEITQAAEQSRSAFIRNSLIVGCVFVLLIATLLYNRNQVKQKANNALAGQKEKIEFQNMQLGIKNKSITDSIKYAKRLQEAILPPTTLIKRLLPDSFFLYKPKDIVSGDFYFVEEWGSKTFVAAVDCTGHGVPGAFMSIVGYNLLNQALSVYGLNKPFLILNDLNKNISKMLHQTEEDSTVKDGMDISLISIDMNNMLLEYAGAYNPLWIVRTGPAGKQLIELKGDKFPVGAFVGEAIESFTPNEMRLEKGDMIFLFTDGYSDQFGGDRGKKFKYRQLQEMLIESSDMRTDEQCIKYDQVFEKWKGSLEQVDDILLIGIRI